MSGIDLFESYQDLPVAVQEVLAECDEDGDPYEECRKLEKALEPLGYTFEWGLDGEPFNLQKF